MLPLRITARRLMTVASLLWLATISNTLRGDGLSDNQPAKVRPIPPVGIELTEAVRDELSGKARQICDALENAVGASDADGAEVLVFVRAIELALEQSTLYKEPEIDQARGLVELALRRAEIIQATKPENSGPRWLNEESESSSKPNTDSNSRLIVGGFRSKIDGSIQPYGLVVPKSFKPGDTTPKRLDVWLHGRGEQTLEVQFLHQRVTQVGEISPADTIVLHPFGRYSNAFKFAGEIDVLEAIEHVKTLFPIDDDRINIRGFSMGGAGCWQMAVHYPDMWMAATPGGWLLRNHRILEGFSAGRVRTDRFPKTSVALV